jgi:hypothetical protein
VSRAGDLARRGAGFVHDELTVETEIRVPLIRSPLMVEGVKRLFDFDFGLVFETLAQAKGVHRADFDAFAAGDALIGSTWEM